MIARADRSRNDPIRGPVRGPALKLVCPVGQASMSEAEFDECFLFSWIGFDHGFVPVTYSLEPARWIALTLRGATIVNQGNSTLFKWGFPREGARFLSSRHSEIATAGPDAATAERALTGCIQHGG